MRNNFLSSGIVFVSAITAFLTGCGNFWQAPSSSGTSTGTTATTTTLMSSNSTPTVGAQVVLTATVSPATATGSVTFYANSASIGTGTLDSGTATLSTSFSTAGTESLTASYGGSSSYASSTSSAVSVTVSAASSSARSDQPLSLIRIATTAYGAAPIHATGAFAATGANFAAQNAESVAVEGGGSVTLTGTELSTGLGADRAILFLNSSPDAVAEAPARFTMTGGSISYGCLAALLHTTCSNGTGRDGQDGPTTVFSVANANAAIDLTDVTVTNNRAGNNDEGILLSTGQADTHHTVAFTAKGCALSGDVMAGTADIVTLALLGDGADNGSSLTGAINPENAAKSVSLTLDASSTWTVTATSHLNSLFGLDISGGKVINIDGGGHCVFYSGSINGANGNTVYTLSGAGFLAPDGALGTACH